MCNKETVITKALCIMQHSKNKLWKGYCIRPCQQVAPRHASKREDDIDLFTQQQTKVARCTSKQLRMSILRQKRKAYLEVSMPIAEPSMPDETNLRLFDDVLYLPLCCRSTEKANLQNWTRLAKESRHTNMKSQL